MVKSRILKRKVSRNRSLKRGGQMLRNLSSNNLGMANNAIKRYHNSLHSQNGRGMNNKSRKVVARCVKKAKKGKFKANFR